MVSAAAAAVSTEVNSSVDREKRVVWVVWGQATVASDILSRRQGASASVLDVPAGSRALRRRAYSMPRAPVRPEDGDWR